MKKSLSDQEIAKQISFRPELKGFVGVEREYYLASGEDDKQGRAFGEWVRMSMTDPGMPVPESQKFLEGIGNSSWIYELSACQVEYRTKPHGDLTELLYELESSLHHGAVVAERLGLRLFVSEIGPEGMPLDVYPDDRYTQIKSGLSQEKLRAACRVTGVHVHIGVDCMQEAVRANNILAGHILDLAQMGDHSSGERLRVYKGMAEDWRPRIYDSPEHYYETARECGFAKRIRDCWHLVRISRYGTVELRMFGATADSYEIIRWVKEALSFIGYR
ncbi:MAG: glutamate-cysteine ligase family protein [bacterium]